MHPDVGVLILCAYQATFSRSGRWWKLTEESLWEGFHISLICWWVQYKPSCARIWRCNGSPQGLSPESWQMSSWPHRKTPASAIWAESQDVGDCHCWWWNMALMFWAWILAEQLPMVVNRQPLTMQELHHPHCQEDNDDHILQSQRSHWVHGQRNNHQCHSLQNSACSSPWEKMLQGAWVLEVWFPDFAWQC